MNCPFCNEDTEPKESTSGNRVEFRCPKCGIIVAAYLKGMEETLKNLVSMKRFERGTK